MRIGSYIVVSVLGRGSFGEVFLAVPDRTREERIPVAIKRVRPDLGQSVREFTDSLSDEARIGRMMRHENVVQAWEYAADGDGWYLTMEYVRGVTLAELISATRRAELRLPPAMVHEIGIAICAGLHHAHSLRDKDGRLLRLVHRDLKPANIMLDTHGVVKVMDFGIAKARSNTRNPTLTGVIKGTPPYMSPEQVQALGELGPRSDIHAVGAILYELAAGRKLFRGSNTMEVMYDVVHGDVIERLEELDEQAPGLGPIVAGCVAKNPAERWSHAAALAEELKLLRAREPIPERTEHLAEALLVNPDGPRRPVRRSVSFSDFVRVFLQRNTESWKPWELIERHDRDITLAGTEHATGTR